MKKLSQCLFGAKRNVPIASRSNRFVLALTYFFYFGLLGIFVPYVGLFLDDRGFTSAQIGTLLAFVAFSRILGPNLWASIADKSGRVGEVLRLGCLLAFSVFIAIFVVHEYWLLTLTFCLMMMFWTAVLPQLEVTTVEATANTNGGYGKLRLWGSIGFIVCSILVGVLIDLFGVSVVIVASSIALGLLYTASLFVVTPNVKPQVSNNSGGDWKQALGVVFVVFLLANTLLQVSFGTYYNFFALYMNDLGYSGMTTGIFIAIGVTAEVFIFMYAARLLQRFNVMSMLAISILLTALRWLILAYFPERPIIIGMSQVLHALSFGLTHAASVFFLSQHFSKQFQSRAQALYVSVAFGIGGAAGSFIAGIMWQQGAGAAMSFNFSALMAFIGGLMLVMLRLNQDKEKQQHA